MSFLDIYIALSKFVYMHRMEDLRSKFRSAPQTFIWHPCGKFLCWMVWSSKMEVLSELKVH